MLSYLRGRVTLGPACEMLFHPLVQHSMPVLSTGLQMELWTLGICSRGQEGKRHMGYVVCGRCLYWICSCSINSVERKWDIDSHCMDFTRFAVI